MTAPVPHGYPDFGRFIAGADKLLAQESSVDIDASTTYGPYFVGDIPYVRFHFSDFVFAFDVVIVFYEDEAGLVTLGTEYFTTNALDVFDQAFPALGPFMKVFVIPFQPNSSFGYTITAAHSLWHPSHATFLSWLPFSGADINYAVGTTNLDGRYVTPGPAVFHGHCSTALTRMDLQAIDAAGVPHHLCRILNANGLVAFPVQLPAAHLRLVITNGSAGVAPFTYSLMTQYGGVQ